MFYIVLGIHLTLCVGLIGLVLIQQGKGADAGAIMGGGTDAVLGAGAAGSALSKLTTSLAIGFMLTSVVLVKQYQGRTVVRTSSSQSVLEGSVMAPVAEQEKIAEQVKADIAANEAAEASAEAVEQQEAVNEGAVDAVVETTEGAATESTTSGATAVEKAVEGNVATGALAGAADAAETDSSVAELANEAEETAAAIVEKVEVETAEAVVEVEGAVAAAGEQAEQAKETVAAPAATE